STPWPSARSGRFSSAPCRDRQAPAQPQSFGQQILWLSPRRGSGCPPDEESGHQECVASPAFSVITTPPLSLIARNCFVSAKPCWRVDRMVPACGCPLTSGRGSLTADSL